MSSLLSVSDLTVRFPRGGSFFSAMTSPERGYFYALRRISLDLSAGETLGLIGQSGSGKSTLARTIVGLQSAQEGSVIFDGQELIHLAEKDYRAVRRNLAMIFQDPVASLSPRKTVEQLVIEPFRIHEPRRKNLHQEAMRLMALVGLEAGLLSAYPHELSGGQARRVGIARALALDPAVIIADEPTAGLDVSIQGEIINLLIRLQDELNIAYLFITHNLALARHVCDRLAILYSSSLVEVGATEEVVSRPAHPYTRQLLGTLPHADLTIRGAAAPPVQDNLYSDDMDSCVFHKYCSYSRDICRRENPGYRRTATTHLSKCHFSPEQLDG